MRILLLAQKMMLPLTNGFNLHNYNFTRQLVEHHEVHLLSLAEGELSDEMRDLFASVRVVEARQPPREWLVKRALLCMSPVSKHDMDPAVMEALEETIRERQIDLVWESGWKMLRYTSRLKGIPVFGDIQDEGAVSIRRMVSKAQGLKRKLRLFRQFWLSKRYQQVYFRHLAACNVVSTEDREAVLHYSPDLHVTAVNNGVDAQSFRPTGVVEEPATLAFHGNISFWPNHQAAAQLIRRVLPLVRQEIPDARLLIIGRDPPPDIAAAAGPDVEVTGFVDDVGPVLGRATVYACLLFGGAGIKNKILEAWALERAVVATPISLGGLVFEPDGNIVVAEGIEAFAAACVRLMRDPEARRRLGAAGRQTIVDHYSWEAKGREFRSALEGAVEL
jgi:glycosyltransferase involved in cell wall biosynthesis